MHWCCWLVDDLVRDLHDCQFAKPFKKYKTKKRNSPEHNKQTNKATTNTQIKHSKQKKLQNKKNKT